MSTSTKKNTALLFLTLCVLSACGGGGSNGAGNTSGATTVSELEGTWIAATDSNYTGTSCGLTASGTPGERLTITFNLNRYTVKSESCAIVLGNKGSYILADTASGTFSIGDIVVTSSDPTAQMRALDLMGTTTIYTSYNLMGNQLHVALPFQTYDGSARDKRAFQIATFLDPATKQLVVNPTFVRQ